MGEVEPGAADELAGLRKRVGKLAEEKSHLQLIIHMMRKLSTFPGLENTVQNMLKTLLENIGGTNIIIYYLIDSKYKKYDVYGNSETISELDDDFILKASRSKEAIEYESVPSISDHPIYEQPGSRTWIYPLLVGSEIIGILKIEGAYQRLSEIKSFLPIFFNYAALKLKNEIIGFTQLQQAYNELSQANAAMVKEIQERKLAEGKLKEYADALAQGHAELQQAYDKLTSAHAQLLQKDKMASIGQLAAGIAHEINTPTQFISDNTVFLRDSLKDVLAFLASLRQECAADAASESSQTSLKERLEALDVDYMLDEVPRALQQSLEGVGRVSRIVSAMKDFSHPGTEEKSLVDLNQALESTLTVSRNEWKYAATLETDLDPGLPRVPCFLGEFNQVVLNLLINASHAIKEVLKDQDPSLRGTIGVSTRKVEGGVEIRISDTGSGIPPHIQPRIFEPFFTTKEVGKGTGLGLSIAYDIIVNKHGGSIRVSSEEGKGSTFILGLPLRAGGGYGPPEPGGIEEPRLESKTGPTP